MEKELEMDDCESNCADCENGCHRDRNEFLEDFRKENPGLHMLYVKWGVKHLRVIDQCLRKLSAQSNLNMWDSIIALQNERQKLVDTNAAYKDANEILNLARGRKERGEERE